MFNFLRIIVTFNILILANLLPAQERIQALDHGVTLRINYRPFLANEHKITLCENHPCLIDAKLFYGSDGTMPKTQFNFITFETKGRSITLDVSSMYEADVYQNFKLEKHDRVFILTGKFSDGAGAYIAQWMINEYGSVRTHLSNGEHLYKMTQRARKIKD